MLLQELSAVTSLQPSNTRITLKQLKQPPPGLYGNINKEPSDLRYLRMGWQATCRMTIDGSSSLRALMAEM